MLLNIASNLRYYRDVSFNLITHIDSNAFADLTSLTELFVHNGLIIFLDYLNVIHESACKYYSKIVSNGFINKIKIFSYPIFLHIDGYITTK